MILSGLKMHSMEDLKVNRKHLQFVLIILCITLLTGFIFAQNYNVKVITSSGNEIKGLLLHISSNGVRLDPEGPVSLRFIKSDHIQSVYIIELDKELTYPLLDSDIPAEVSGDLEVSTKHLGGFSDFALSAAVGQAYAGGDYYEGFDSGLTYHFRGTYFLPSDSRFDSRFFISFSYYSCTIAPEENSLYISGMNITFDDMDIDQYALEMGRTTDIIGKDSYLFFLFGLVYMDHEIKATGEYYGDTASDTYTEDKFALRFEVGGNIGINPQLGLGLSLGIDLVLSKNQNNDPYSYNSSPTTASGTILNFAAGLNFEL
jgi:hypothetical protein